MSTTIDLFPHLFSATPRETPRHLNEVSPRERRQQMKRFCGTKLRVLEGSTEIQFAAEQSACAPPAVYCLEEINKVFFLDPYINVALCGRSVL